MLENVKGNLRETLLEGIDETISALKAILPKHTEKMHSLILIESQLKDISKQQMRGVIAEPDAQLMRNKIRASLMDLINGLSPADLESRPAAASASEVVSEVVKNEHWAAELIEENGLELLKFRVKLDTPDVFLIELTLPQSDTRRLTINGVVVEETRLNVANTIGAIFNILTKNRETLRFQLAGKEKVYTANLSYGVSIANSSYIKIVLQVNGKVLLTG